MVATCQLPLVSLLPLRSPLSPLSPLSCELGAQTLVQTACSLPCDAQLLAWRANEEELVDGSKV